MAVSLQGPLMGLRQFLTIKSPLKMMKNDEKWFSWLFGYAEKGLDKKAMINFKIYEVTDWATNNYNTHITQMVSTLIWIYFGRLWLGHTIKINFITFQIVDPEIYSKLIFNKRVWD